MIGDAQAFERARANASPAFATFRVTDTEAAWFKLDLASRKVLLIDARDIIGSHDGVRNDKVGRLIWARIKSLAPR